MITEDIVNKLNSLAKLDYDALESYNEAIKKIDQSEIREQLSKFRDDHDRHFQVLSDLIIKYGGIPTSRSRDIRGVFLGTATTLQSMAGTEGTLKAVQTGEKITNDSYRDAISQDYPQDVKRVLEKNYDDEQNHLSYVNYALANKTWENRRAA